MHRGPAIVEVAALAYLLKGELKVKIEVDPATVEVGGSACAVCVGGATYHGLTGGGKEAADVFGGG